MYTTTINNNNSSSSDSNNNQKTFIRVSIARLNYFVSKNFKGEPGASSLGVSWRHHVSRDIQPTLRYLYTPYDIFNVFIISSFVQFAGWVKRCLCDRVHIMTKHIFCLILIFLCDYIELKNFIAKDMRVYCTSEDIYLTLMIVLFYLILVTV